MLGPSLAPYLHLLYTLAGPINFGLYPQLSRSTLLGLARPSAGLLDQVYGVHVMHQCFLLGRSGVVENSTMSET